MGRWIIMKNRFKNKRFELKWKDTGEVLYDNETGASQYIYSPQYRFHVRDMMNEMYEEVVELKRLNDLCEEQVTELRRLVHIANNIFKEELSEESKEKWINELRRE